MAQETIAAQPIKLEDDITTYLTSHAGITELRDSTEDSQTLFMRANEAIKALEGTREITRTL
ncbi:hypothetical protein MNBD_GAMMA04-1411 [hydrothermal vent metagenome]|uniref:Uncharacterized protein n=1 Tax=hydrothermal vent metagenome TaxID=652676 RepID=A0A3B0WFA3_9ZZZZ